MADVFVSYASEDRAKAEQLSAALTAAGFSVWWDHHIVIGEAYDTAIERELEAAASVVVLWSANSVSSAWVKNEALVAEERGVLIPAMIEPVKLPLEFRRKQTADLSAWSGDVADPRFQALLRALALAAGRPSPPAVPPSSPPRRQRVHMVVALLLVAGAAAIGLYSFWPLREDALSTPAAAEVANAAATAQATAPAAETTDLAALVAGYYFGNVASDSQGSSRQDVGVTLTRLDAATVRASSDYPRIGTIDIDLVKVGENIQGTAGNTSTVFIVYLDQSPSVLLFNPRGELAYNGTRQ